MYGNRSSKENMFKLVEDLVVSKKITRDGGLWLKMALDPFCDKIQNCAGWPDANSSPSVVETFVSTANIIAPNGVTDTWDLAVANFPVASWQALGAYAGLNNYTYATTYDTSAQSTHLGSVVYATGDSGQPLFPNTAVPGATWTPTNYEFATLHARPAALASIPCRVIAAGYELHNTTASLNRQDRKSVV